MTNVLTAIHIIMYTKQRSHAAEALNPDIKKPVRDYVQKNGAKETRTPDPLHAMQVLYQLSYGPIDAGKQLGSCRRQNRAYIAKPQT